MAITYVATSSAGSTTSSQAVNKPTGTQDNDLMISAVISAEDVNSVPSGWTLIETSTPGYRFNTYYKIASSEGASYTWGFATSGIVGIHISTYRGAKVSSPIYANTMNQIEGTNASINAGTWSVGETGKFILALAMEGGATVTFTKDNTPISGWAEDYDGSAGSTSCQFASVVWNSSGAFNNCSTTMSTSRSNQFKMMQMLALNPPIIYTLTADYGSFTLTGYDSALKRIYKIIANYATFVLTGFSATLTKIKHGAIFTNTTKNSATMTNTTKNSATFTNQTKNSSSFTNEIKS